MLGMPPPNNYQQFINMAKQIDTNYDGRISKLELFNLFKRTTGYWEIKGWRYRMEGESR